MKCKWHTCENEAKENPYKGHEPIFCSKNCKNKQSVDTYRKKVKLTAIEYMGGSCIDCGYNKCPAAMHFHHLDPSQKDFRISQTTNLEKMYIELAKCVLLCANCHAERHWLTKEL